MSPVRVVHWDPFSWRMRKKNKRKTWMVVVNSLMVVVNSLIVVAVAVVVVASFVIVVVAWKKTNHQHH